ncbi:uncharacterized protein [Henckelia pumila]|uniref:uncharacterized protein n=1 Tax=Henckelia pumila TaxID=405737 RepID=UPI003C6E3E01
MKNGDDHIDKKRKINDHSSGLFETEEDTDNLLNLSLSLINPSTVSTPDPSPSLSPSPPLSPTFVPVHQSPVLNPQRIFYPRPAPFCQQFFSIPALGSPRQSPLPSAIYTQQTPPASSPVYQIQFATATLNPPILPLQPSSSPLPPQQLSQEPSGNGHGNPQPPRSRRNPTQLPRGGKSIEISPPYPWATNRRATVLSLRDLLSSQIHTIAGNVQCKRCERNYEMGFDLRQKSFEIFQYIIENKSQMYDRAPSAWMSPALPTCKYCGKENSVKPIISDKKKTVNWLFLLLGQMLGFCTLGQLKYFCKHTKNHRTGSKDRVLYLTYMGLCKQLDPNGPFDR